MKFNRFVLSLLFFSALIVGVSASTTTINSPYSTVTNLGNGTYIQSQYSDPVFKVNATGQWNWFTSNMTWNQTGTGEIINWTYNHTAYSVFVKNLGPQWNVVDNGGGLSLWFNVTVPQTNNGTFTTFFPSTWTPYWQGVNSTSFCGYGICLGFPDYNRQGDLNGSFNSTVAIYVNASNNLVVQINYSCSLAGGCFETFDPFVSQGPSDDVSYYGSTDLSQNSWPVLKFLTSGIPANATILDAELGLQFSGTIGTVVAATLNLSVFNGTTDWNQSTGNTSLVAVMPYTNSLNYTIVNKTIKGWEYWNVTNGFSYAYSSGLNATFRIQNPGDAPSQCVTGVGGPCMFAITSVLNYGQSGGFSKNAYSFNSTRANGFFPALNITYTVSGLNWFNPVVTSTSAGASTTASVLWTDLNENLSNATFTLDLGNGTLINYSTISMTGISNFSNFTFTNNATIGATERWGVYAYDNISDLNFTGLQSFTTTTGIITFTNESTCANVTASISLNSTGDPLNSYQFSVNNNTGSFINYSVPIAMSGNYEVVNYSFCAVVDAGSLVQWEVYANNTGGFMTLSNVYTIFPTSAGTVTQQINITPTGNQNNNLLAIGLLVLALAAINLKTKDKQSK